MNKNTINRDIARINKAIDQRQERISGDVKGATGRTGRNHGFSYGGAVQLGRINMQPSGSFGSINGSNTVT